MTESPVSAKPWIVKWREWVSVLIIAPFAAAALVSAPRIPEDSAADFLLEAAGWVCFWTGALFRWWATLYIGGRKTHGLVVEGPYSICRNPLYLGTFLIAMSIPFFLHSVTFAVGLLIAMPIYLSITVPWEEGKLLAIFGDDYRRYRSRVPKLFPDFRLLSSPPSLPVHLSGMKAELRNSLTWMWMPLVAQAVADLRTKAWWPELLPLL